jgi:hypothetical protein
MFSATSHARVLTIESKSLFNIASMPPTREDYPIGCIVPAGLEFPSNARDAGAAPTWSISGRLTDLTWASVYCLRNQKPVSTRIYSLRNAGGALLSPGRALVAGRAIKLVFV